jgi:hypothetical protein
MKVKGALRDSRYDPGKSMSEHSSSGKSSPEREKEKSGVGGDKQKMLIRGARGKSASDFKSHKPKWG